MGGCRERSGDFGSGLNQRVLGQGKSCIDLTLISLLFQNFTSTCNYSSLLFQGSYFKDTESKR